MPWIEQERGGGFVIGAKIGRWRGLNSTHLQVGLKIAPPYIPLRQIASKSALNEPYRSFQHLVEPSINPIQDLDNLEIIE